MSDLYTKQEISQLLHVSYKTLRGYEDKGLITPCQINTENGYKYYDGNQIYTIDMIRYCNQNLDIPLKEIKELLSDENHKEKLISLLLEKKANAETMVKKYQRIIENIDRSLAFNTFVFEKNVPYISHEEQIFYYYPMDDVKAYSDGKIVSQKISNILDSNNTNIVIEKNNIQIDEYKRMGIFSKFTNEHLEKEMLKDIFCGKYLCILYNNYLNNSAIALEKLLTYSKEHNLALDTSSYYFEFQSIDISVAKLEDVLVILKIRIAE